MIRLSVEVLESREVPTRLSTALANISSQQFVSNATTEGYGAINYAYGPARYDGSTPAYLADTYFTGIASIALVRERASDAQSVVGKWINWNLRTLGNDGTFLRHYYYADGSVPPTNPTMPADADDSAASLFFMVSDEYAQAGYDTSILTAAGVKAKYELAGAKLLSLQQSDGLTLGSTSYPVKFLMDNCESYAGFLAMSRLELVVWNDPAQAAVYATAAAQVNQGIRTTLYDTSTGLFKWTSNDPNDVSKFYPFFGVAFPALYGALDMTSAADLGLARSQIQTIDNYWNGLAHADWRTGPVDLPTTGGYFATALAYATLLSGNTADATTFTNTVYNTYYPGTATTPQYNLLTVADNGWLAMALGAIDGNPAVGTTLTVTGTTAADTFVLSTTPNRGTGNLTLSFNGGIPQAYTGITAVSVTGEAGNDSLTVYPPFGTALVSGAVSYNGGTASGEANTLTVSAPDQTAYTTGTAVGVGQLFTMQIGGMQKVTLNGVVTVNANSGPDTTDRAAISSSLSANERWLSRVYTDVLARPLDSGGRAYWLTQLNNGTGTRASVLAGITNSAEAHILTVQRWYSLYLGRSAAIDANNYWVQLLSSGKAEEEVMSGIIGSDEFFNRAQTLFTGTANERYVKALYHFLLFRDPADVSYWTNQLTTSSRQAVANGFLYSTEYRIYQLQGAFVAYLQRTSDQSGVNFYLSGGMGTGNAALRSFVLSSLEYSQL